MRFTHILLRQHIGRMTNRHWFIQGKIKIRPTGTEEILTEHGINVEDINDVIDYKQEIGRTQNNTNCQSSISESFQSYNIEPCFVYKDNNLLLEGLEQAKVLTNTVEFQGLPERILEREEMFELSKEIHSEIKKKIMLSCVFESTQQKLPIRKDPLWPAWNFPRDYGITDIRKNDLLCKNLLAICEQKMKKNNYSVVNDTYFCFPVNAHGKNLQFEVTSDVLVTTSEKLSKICEPSVTSEIALPDIYPVHCTISLVRKIVNDMENFFPMNKKSKYPYVKTAFTHLNYTQINNPLKDIVEAQVQGRSLLNGFTIAAAQARAFFGDDVAELPEPIVIPVVHSDGQLFHFSFYQLNTLEIDKKKNIKNIFWNSPRIPLYDACVYNAGRPLLENYNESVIKRLLAFLTFE